MNLAAPSESFAPKIRTVAKIWSSSDDNHGASEGVFVNKPQGEDSTLVNVSFGQQFRGGYDLDFCYEQHQGNNIVFEREIKPLIHRVFDGHNATTIVTGANNFDKACLIQGTLEDKGLIFLTAISMIEMANNCDKVVSLSMFELTSDHMVDILDETNHKIQLMGDSVKNIQIKKLSKVTLSTSVAFQNFFERVSKLRSGPLNKSHIGLYFYVSTQEGQLVGKMSIIDVSVYQNYRRKNFLASTLMTTMKINKSIHAIHNVLHALSANETHIPFRESNLTHFLQDSLGRTSKILVITCLSQSICQDAIYMVSLASRCCQNSIKGTSSSIKKPKSSARLTLDSYKSPIICRASNNTKKHIESRSHSVKKENVGSSTLNARRLFVEKKINQTGLVSIESCLSENPAIVGLYKGEHSSKLSLSVSTSALENSCKKEEDQSSHAIKDVVNLEKDLSLLDAANSKELATFEKDIHKSEDQCTDIIPLTHDTNNENICSSPPISVQLQELSNSLKLLCNYTPYTNKEVQLFTPIKSNENFEILTRSPWQTGARIKDSIIQDYLFFLNTATKEELKKLKGIGDKRATYIVELRNQSSQPFKHLDDLKGIGLSSKQINQMLKNELGGLFN